MKFHHVFATWIVLWFPFLILRVNDTVKKKKKRVRNCDKVHGCRYTDNMRSGINMVCFWNSR